MIRHLATSLAALLLTAATALAFQPMSASIKVSSGTLYDYVIIGLNPNATDGFDNAYDTISPGNLNADMGEPFISAIIPHPDWKPAMRELRGDIRSPAKSKQWQLAVTSSLPEGTPLKLSLQQEGTVLPAAVTLKLKDRRTGKVLADLKSGEHTVSAPGPGKKSMLLVVAEQP